MKLRTTEEYEKATGRKTPNVYWHDHHNHMFGTLTLIWYGITPTGRTSKHYHQFRIYQKGKFANATRDEIFERAVKGNPEEFGYKLPKGYKWSEPLIQHDFLNF